ncbi:MAG: peroxide stress protein YaaA [Pseudomonadota bacterium]
MLIVLSPAKNLNFEPADGRLTKTEPRLADDTGKLIETLRKKTPSKLAALMSLSDNLSTLNAERYKAFGTQSKKQAILAFNGDVYRGFDASSLDAKGLAAAQDRVRILSGLYGLLRPLDEIEPYRLEMGTSLKTRRGETLYDFWGDRIGKLLNEELGDAPLINCASNEYFKSVQGLNNPVITCQFKEEKDGKHRVLGFFAKAARGMMARFAVDQRIDDPEGLKDFNTAGYKFEPSLSNAKTWVFARPQPPKQGA